MASSHPVSALHRSIPRALHTCTSHISPCTPLLSHARRLQPLFHIPQPSSVPVSKRSINTTTTPITDNTAIANDVLVTTPPQQLTPSKPKRHAAKAAAKPQPAPVVPPSPPKIKPVRIHTSHPGHSPRYELSRAPTSPSISPPHTSVATTLLSATNTTIPTPRSSAANPYPSPSSPATEQLPLALTPSLRANLPHLTSQPPFYITIHIHGRPYLVTAGDTLRLPFLMHGVTPGDILRLDRASLLGSRDWTLKAPVGGTRPAPTTISPASPADLITGDTPAGTGSDVHPIPALKSRLRQLFLDDRLFVCRAVVLGTESEPLRIKEKTKRRQRRVKKAKSKHRYTVLRIGEVRVRDAEELERLAELGEVEARVEPKGTVVSASMGA